MTDTRICCLVAFLCLTVSSALAQAPADLQKTMDERDHLTADDLFLSDGSLWVLDVWIRPGNTWRVAAVQTTDAKK